jgi:hypothetical protein
MLLTQLMVSDLAAAYFSLLELVHLAKALPRLINRSGSRQRSCAAPLCPLASRDYWAEENITADVDLIPIQQVNEAYERTISGAVRYRFVIDIKTLRSLGRLT